MIRVMNLHQTQVLNFPSFKDLKLNSTFMVHPVLNFCPLFLHPFLPNLNDQEPFIIRVLLPWPDCPQMLSYAYPSPAMSMALSCQAEWTATDGNQAGTSGLFTSSDGTDPPKQPAELLANLVAAGIWLLVRADQTSKTQANPILLQHLNARCSCMMGMSLKILAPIIPSPLLIVNCPETVNWLLASAPAPKPWTTDTCSSTFGPNRCQPVRCLG